ncbi:hypothetical protein [Lapidilactobacillus bayanensis]|uniref:hypothetical protein n=1 Tax=Lapidilactobacillus bayanensis TaxID=2485998 RepID=UPI000F78842A|nr:hypothetical protein [Lapidilactobacillus bayanensis]
MFKNKQNEAVNRGHGFIYALDVNTVEQALATGNEVPVQLKFNGEISELRYGGQENYLRLEILPDQLIFTANQDPTQTKTIPLPPNYPLTISVIKHPNVTSRFLTVEVYVLLTIKNQDQTYQILSSDFPALPKLLDYLTNQQINYTIPDYYQAIFAETNTTKLQRAIEKDNRFASKLLPGLPPSSQPHPLSENS